MASTVADVQHTFSSWDSCMSKVYCKWPVIAAIIIGSLIALSVAFCVVRCVCFGVSCCSCCCSSMSCCCGNGRSKANRGWENYSQPAPPPVPYQYPQYNSPAPPVYNQTSPYQARSTATFDAPTKTPHHNADALPSMPTWSDATTRRVEDEHVEMDRLEHGHDAQQHLLSTHNTQYQQYPEQAHGQPQYNRYQGQHEQSYSAYGQQDHGYLNQRQQSYNAYGQQDDGYSSQQQHSYGDVGNTNATPYHDYGHHQQYAPSMSPVSSMYAPSTAVPPSYHTSPPSVASPTPVQYPATGHAIERRPVQGSWRDV